MTVKEQTHSDLENAPSHFKFEGTNAIFILQATAPHRRLGTHPSDISFLGYLAYFAQLIKTGKEKTLGEDRFRPGFLMLLPNVIEAYIGD